MGKSFNSILVAGLILLSLVSCSKLDYGKPWMDSGLKKNIRRGMDVSLSDDFFLAVNYEKLLKMKKSRTELSDLEKTTITVLTDENLVSHEAELVQDIYKACTDWKTRNEIGIEPVKKQIEKIKSLESIPELSEFICSKERDVFVPVFLNFTNMPAVNNRSKYMTYVSLDKLLLGNANEYIEMTNYGKSEYKVYEKEFTSFCKRLGWSKKESAEVFEKAIALETLIAKSALQQGVNGSSTTKTGLCNTMRNFPVEKLMDYFGCGETNWLWLDSMEPFYILNQNFTDEHLEEIKSYMIVKYALTADQLVDKKSFQNYQKCRKDSLISKDLLTDDKLALDTIKFVLKEPYAMAFIEKYNYDKEKEEIKNLCYDIINEYRQMLLEEDWLSEVTRQRAIEKLDAIRVNSLYPDKWNDYSELSFKGLSFYEMIQEAVKQRYKINAAKTNKNVDYERWANNDFGILDVNAFYSGSENSINILLGMYCYDRTFERTSKEELYSGLGWAIAHEISHAFDSNGAQLDKDGQLANWWTQEDWNEFSRKVSKVISYYDKMTTFNKEKINAQNICREAMADMTEMKCILNLCEKKDDFDYDLFFKSYAGFYFFTVSRSEKNEYKYLLNDTHPLAYLRVNATLQQFEKFREFYGIARDEGMYLSVMDNVLVW